MVVIYTYNTFIPTSRTIFNLPMQIQTPFTSSIYFTTCIHIYSSRIYKALHNLGTLEPWNSSGHTQEKLQSWRLVVFKHLNVVSGGATQFPRFDRQRSLCEIRTYTKFCQRPWRLISNNGGNSSTILDTNSMRIPGQVTPNSCDPLFFSVVFPDRNQKEAKLLQIHRSWPRGAGHLGPQGSYSVEAKSFCMTSLIL